MYTRRNMSRNHLKKVEAARRGTTLRCEPRQNDRGGKGQPACAPIIRTIDRSEFDV